MKNKAKDFIKKEIQKQKITYSKLSALMESKGYVYSENTIRSKINPLSFILTSLLFFLLLKLYFSLLIYPFFVEISLT